MAEITTNGSTPLIDNAPNTTLAATGVTLPAGYAGWMSEVKLPSGLKYKIRGVDTELRTRFNEYLNKQLNTIIAWNGEGTPSAANIPAGVVVGTTTGSLAASAATTDSIYLVKSSSQTGGDVYDEYITIRTSGDSNDAQGATFAWEKLGDTQLTITPTKGRIVEVSHSHTVNVTAADNGAVVTGLGTNDKVSAITELGAGTVPAYEATNAGTALGTNTTFKAGFDKTDAKIVMPANATLTVSGYKTKNDVNALTTGTSFSTSANYTTSVKAITGTVVKSVAIGDTATNGSTAISTGAIQSAVLTTTAVDGQTATKVITKAIGSVANNTGLTKVITGVTASTGTDAAINKNPLQGAEVANECLSFGAFTFSEYTGDLVTTTDATSTDLYVSTEAANTKYINITSTSDTDYAEAIPSAATFATTATGSTTVASGVEVDTGSSLTVSTAAVTGLSVIGSEATLTAGIDDKDTVNVIGGIETSGTNAVTFAAHTTDEVYGTATTISKANLTTSEESHTHDVDANGTGGEVVTDLQ